MCHPERRAKPEVEPAGRHVVSVSTLSGVTKPIADPQNAMRFDFTKSAIYRRFCKVRLLKHPTGMFLSAQDDTEGDVLQYYSVSPLSVPASLRELRQADTFSAGEGFL